MFAYSHKLSVLACLAHSNHVNWARLCAPCTAIVSTTRMLYHTSRCCVYSSMSEFIAGMSRSCVGCKSGDKTDELTGKCALWSSVMDVVGERASRQAGRQVRKRLYFPPFPCATLTAWLPGSCVVIHIIVASSLLAQPRRGAFKYTS